VVHGQCKPKALNVQFGWKQPCIRLHSLTFLKAMQAYPWKTGYKLSGA
jgi:hypothetical protein